MSIITNPVLSVTAFEGTSLERTLTASIDMSQPDALKLAITECFLQAEAIEEAAGVELHIAALEKAQGKKLTKAQRELVTMSYNLANGGEVDEQVEQEKVEENGQEKAADREAEPQVGKQVHSEGTDTSTEPSGVEEESTPEPSEDPVADAVKEVAEESGIDSDAATDAALAELGL